jgi:hypothetical protein
MRALRLAAVLLGLAASTVAMPQAQPGGNAYVPSNFIAGGTIFTLSSGTGGCATSGTLVGGSTAGSFQCTTTAGASTIVINLPTAKHGWVCAGNDVTDSLVFVQTASSATSCTISVTTGSNPATLNFLAIGF